MSDHAQFESLRMKARKLAALNAGEKRMRELVCVLDPRKPRPADEDGDEWKEGAGV